MIPRFGGSSPKTRSGSRAGSKPPKAVNRFPVPTDRASISELKAKLSRYLAAVKAGEVIVTEPGRPVSSLLPWSRYPPSSDPTSWPKRKMPFEPRDYLRHILIEADYLLKSTSNLNRRLLRG